MLKNRESIIELAVKDYNERNKKGAEYTVHDALYYSLEEHDARDLSQDEWEDLLWTIEKKVNNSDEEEEDDNERFHVLWKWDNEVYEVIGETENEYSIINISSGYKSKANKDEVIVINNM